MSDTFERMKQLSERLSRIEPFYVMEILKQAEQARREGVDVIPLSIGEPDFGAPTPVLEALSAAMQAGAMGYTHACGIPALRAAIAQWYQDTFAIHIDAERVIVTAGASGALTLASLALINGGDGVLMPDPCYPCNRHFVAAADGFAQLVPCGAESAFHLQAAQLEEHWQANTRGVLIASPSNPTGTQMNPGDLDAVLRFVGRKNGFAIVDEIYQGLVYNDAPRSALQLPSVQSGEFDDLVVINSFSKYFNMTGWRLGWMIVPRKWVSAFEKLSQNLAICPSSLAQHAALACFKPETLAIYEQRRQIFDERRLFILPALEQAGLNIPVKPDSGFFIYADISASGMNSDQWCARLLKETGVCVVPGKDFSLIDGHKMVRLSYATRLEGLKKASERLAFWLGRLSEQSGVRD